MKKAFSLIELLISLIIISVIAASFAPVVTKKIKHKQLALTQGSKITNECSTANCRICAKKGKTEQCLYCEGTCSYGYKYNTKLCKCEKLYCSSGTFLDGNNCSSCLTKYDNCETCNATECLSCKSDYKLKNGYCKKAVTPTSQSDCDKFNAIFIPNVSGTTILNSGVCMTKINAGDPNGPSTQFTNIKTLVAGKVAAADPTCEASDKCCWSGALNTATSVGDGACSNSTAGAAASKYAKFDYKSCSRTVCNYAAANYICSQYKTEKTKAGDWSLPSSNTINTMKTIMQRIEPCQNPDSAANSCSGPKYVAATATSYIQKYKGADGLQLCDLISGYGSYRCATANNRCKGSTLTYHNSASKQCCGPALLWISNGNAAVLLRGTLWNDGNWSYKSAESTTDYSHGTYDKNSALSVRCVLTSFLED